MSEYKEQCIIFQWAVMHQNKFPCLKYLNGSLNGVRLTIGNAMKAKRAGMNKGYPDIFLPYDNGTSHGLFIELKVKKNKPSKEQLDWLEYLTLQGYKTHVCYGSKEAIEVIKKYVQHKD